MTRKLIVYTILIKIFHFVWWLLAFPETSTYLETLATFFSTTEFEKLYIIAYQIHNAGFSKGEKKRKVSILWFNLLFWLSHIKSKQVPGDGTTPEIHMGCRSRVFYFIYPAAAPRNILALYSKNPLLLPISWESHIKKGKYMILPEFKSMTVEYKASHFW